ncbi:MAG: DNA polymerase III subunit [Oscillospiraceae bacterium]|nr:DNA polymerase III subunit [Oscillospiraceae bacterium]
MKLYSKDSVTNAVSAMKKGGRMAHAFLLQGEKGAGKKVSAFYIAKTLMCDDIKDGVPCGKCNQCRRIDEGIHPDVIIPERTGKLMLYNAETIGEMYRDAFIMPNDCDVKVYILPDCENIQERTQNKMLKLIEEPPDHAYFIFTARDKSSFLPTIISRVITIGVPECSEEECREALRESGKYTDEQIEDAVSVYHGNIGCSMAYLDGGEGAEEIALCRSIADAVADGNEYGLCKAFFTVGEDRARLRTVLAMFDRIIRDVCMIRLHGKDKAELAGCYRQGAEKLAEKLSFKKAQDIHDLLLKNIDYCHSNVNVQAAMAALCGSLM